MKLFGYCKSNMEYYYNRDLLQDKFDNNENKLIVYCEISGKVLEQEIIFNEDMSLDFKCSCGIKYCDHLEMLIYYIKNNYFHTYKNHFFKINYEHINKYLSIPISGSRGDSYLFEIKYDYTKNFSYHCSCGLRYTKYCRHKCKHIENTLCNIVDKFDNLKEEYDENNDLNKSFEDLDIK